MQISKLIQQAAQGEQLHNLIKNQEQMRNNGNQADLKPSIGIEQQKIIIGDAPIHRHHHEDHHHHEQEVVVVKQPVVLPPSPQKSPVLHATTTTTKNPFTTYLNYIQTLSQFLFKGSSVQDQQDTIQEFVKKAQQLFLCVANMKKGKHRNKKKTLQALTAASVYHYCKIYRQVSRTIKELLKLMASVVRDDKGIAVQVQTRQFTNALKLIQNIQNSPSATAAEESTGNNKQVQPLLFNKGLSSAETSEDESDEMDDENQLVINEQEVVEEKVVKVSPVSSPCMVASSASIEKQTPTAHVQEPIPHYNNDKDGNLNYFADLAVAQCLQQEKSNSVSLSTQKVDFAKRVCSIVFQGNEKLFTRCLEHCNDLFARFPSRVARTITAAAIFLTVQQEEVANQKKTTSVSDLLDMATKAADVNSLSVRNVLKEIRAI